MKKILSAILISVFVFALSGCSNVDPQKVDKTTSENTSGTEAAKSNIFNIGDTIKMGNLQFTVNGVRTSNGNDFIKPKDGNVYLYVSVTVENTGNSEEIVSSLMMFKLVDKEGVSHDIALASDANGQVDGSLASGRKMKGELTYEVPKNVKDYELEIDPTFGDGIAIVKLQVK